MTFLKNLMTLVTADFGLSDIWHQYLPFKYILSQALKQGHLPIWTRLIGGGQPILAQGQMGAFNFLNLIIFGLLPFTIAVTLFYLLNLILACLGGYLLGRTLNFKKPAALFLGQTFSWSGFLIAHASHWDIFQAASLMPFTFYFLFKAYYKKNYKFLLYLSFIISQQIFTGAIQIVFINILGLITLVVVWYSKKKVKQNFLFKFFLFLIFSLGLSAIQLAPSFQYVQKSVRSKGLSYANITNYPYRLNHILTFWDPFFFGSPKNGTYPAINQGAGIFWENTAYIGKVGLILAVICIFLKLKGKKGLIKFWAICLLFLSLILSFGDDSPLYFIYTFFPFNLFRVPSRFLLLVSLSLIILASLSLNELIFRFNKKGKLLVILILVFNFADIYLNFYNYHPLDNIKKWLTPPPTVNKLYNLDSEKIFSMPSLTWNSIFFSQGWENKNDDYYYLRNNLDPNLNMLFNINHLREHNSIPLKTTNLLDQLTYYQIRVPELKESINLPNNVTNLLRLNGVKYIISTNQIKSDMLLNNSSKVEGQNDLPNYYIYQVYKPAEFIRMAFKAFTTNNLVELNQILSEKNFDIQNSVILSEYQGEFPETEKENLEYEITVYKNTNTNIELKVKNKSRGVLVIADNYYPEWKAIINNKQVEILAVNLTQKGIVLPPGEHQIKIYYKAKYLKMGAVISILCYAFLAINIAWFKKNTNLDLNQNL